MNELETPIPHALTRLDYYTLGAIITIISVLALILLVALWQWLAWVGLIIVGVGLGYAVVHIRAKWEMHRVNHHRSHMENLHTHEAHVLSMATKRARLNPEPYTTYDTHSEIQAELERAMTMFPDSTDTVSPEAEAEQIRELLGKGLSPAAIAGSITGKRSGEEYQLCKMRVLEIKG